MNAPTAAHQSGRVSGHMASTRRSLQTEKGSEGRSEEPGGETESQTAVKLTTTPLAVRLIKQPESDEGTVGWLRVKIAASRRPPSSLCLRRLTQPA